MSLLGYLLVALAKIFSLIIDVYTMIVIVSALISWVNPDPYNPLVRILRGLTEPIYTRIRRLLPRSALHLGIDLSPVILLILLVFIETLFVSFLFDVGQRLLH